jgi:divalent metal cation (Fe/Co/Zn/Cd) transporter
LLGSPPPPEIVHEIRNIARSIPKVLDAHDIVVHNYGTHMFIGIHVEVDVKESSLISHDIAEDVENILRERMLAYTTVHIDPIDQDSPQVKKAKIVIQKIVDSDDRYKSFHDLRVVNTYGHNVVLFDLVMENGFTSKENERAKQDITQSLKKEFPGSDINIMVTPLHTY